MTPYIRVNLECGTDQNVAAGREPCQGGWYEWIGSRWCQGKTILDVGAGMCEGMALLAKAGASQVHGQDIDIRLQKFSDNLIIGPLSSIPDKSYDVVTSCDVIEHVIEDIDFFNELRRIARERIIITTPNFTRSQAQNHCHCREYTLPQFTNLFCPDELWTASPDGKIRHTLLLKKEDNFYRDLTRTNVSYTVGSVPDSLTFTHSAVDGKEWPHICGMFSL